MVDGDGAIGEQVKGLQQEAEAPPLFLTKEEFQAWQTDWSSRANDLLEQHRRSIQSAGDRVVAKEVNTLRQELRGMASQAEQDRQAYRQLLLGMVPEEDRQRYEQRFELEELRRERQGRATTAQATTQDTQQDNDQNQQVIDLVKELGGDPNDQRVYQNIQNVRTWQQLAGILNKNIQGLAPKPAAQIKEPVKEPPVSKAPPVNTGNRRGAMMTEEEATDAFIRGEITRERFVELAPNIANR